MATAESRPLAKIMVFIALLIIFFSSLLSGCSTTPDTTGTAETTATTHDGAVSEAYLRSVAETALVSNPEYADHNSRGQKVIFSGPGGCDNCYIFVFEFIRTKNNTDERVTMIINLESGKPTVSEVSRIEPLAEGEAARPPIPAPKPQTDYHAKTPKPSPAPKSSEAESILREKLSEKGISFSETKLQRSIEWPSAGITEKLYSVKTDAGFLGAVLVLRGSRVEELEIVNDDDNPAMISCFEQMGRYVQRFGENTCIYENGFSCTDSEFKAGKC